jgi:hypothetical protein
VPSPAHPHHYRRVRRFNPKPPTELTLNQCYKVEQGKTVCDSQDNCKNIGNT